MNDNIEDQDFDSLGAMSVNQFSARMNICRTKAWAEIKTGRLKAKKCGGRTLIRFEDARAWLDSLPEVKH